MTTCNICLDYMVDEACSSCLLRFCTLCGKKNKYKCPHCNFLLDPEHRFVKSQITLLSETRNSIQLHQPISADNIKPCPCCGVLIEKERDDCGQMYCIVCSTVWMWSTGSIVTDITDIHNPIYFSVRKQHRKKLRFSNDKQLDSVSRKIYKCLVTLDGQEERYATEAYLNRLAFVIGDIDYSTFENRARLMFRQNTRNMYLRSELSSCYNESMTLQQVMSSFQIESLPFC
jgi:hypothetical protein